jgi:hypothetical protein
MTLALVGGEWSAWRSSHFTPGKRAPSTHCIGGWVGPGANLDYMKKRKFLTLPGLEFWTLGHPAHSQSLYQLSYPSFIQRVYDLKLVSLHNKRFNVLGYARRLNFGKVHVSMQSVACNSFTLIRVLICIILFSIHIWTGPLGFEHRFIFMYTLLVFVHNHKHILTCNPLQLYNSYMVTSKRLDASHRI